MGTRGDVVVLLLICMAMLCMLLYAKSPVYYAQSDIAHTEIQTHRAEPKLNIKDVPILADATNWVPPTLPEHLKTADQRDPELIRHIRQHWIIPPFKGPQNVRRKAEPRWHEDFSSAGQPTIIKGILHDMYNGFFIECGAADGEYISNSLWFELHRQWNGILIEGNPLYFQEMLQKNRHAYMLNACLSPTNRPMMLDFTVDGEGGGITNLVSVHQQQIHHTKNRTYAPVQCFPLYSIMAALDQLHVDYFSMDIEGAEMAVLKTIPYKDLVIDTYSIEKRVINNETATVEKEKEIEQLLHPQGYKTITMVVYDIILAKTSLT